MPISDKHKLIFVHIPKNAGTSITNHLNMVDAGHHSWSYYARKYPHKWQKYKKISIIRNPWDRVVSCYEYAKMDDSYWHSSKNKARAGKHLDYDLLKDMSFLECLKLLENSPKKLRHQGWANQLNYISNGTKIMVDYLIDIKNINEELSKILNEKIEIPLINKSNNNNYRDYYKNDDMIKIVKDYYLMDVKSFNFNF
jgi:hypothetical protein